MADNLTRDEARQRAELISVGSYQVELDVTGGRQTFRSVSTVLSIARDRVRRPSSTSRPRWSTR